LIEKTAPGTQVELHKSGGGVFEITVNGRLGYSKKAPVPNGRGGARDPRLICGRIPEHGKSNWVVRAWTRHFEI
jgi:predicted Rdx family selenoprotein